MTTLISFLGRAKANLKTGYRTARYHFPDGKVRETAFFGLALSEYVGASRLVVLGTAGSMWDVLIEHLAARRPDRFEEARLKLQEAAETMQVGLEHLERLRPLAEEALGISCELVLIPYGRTLEEQERLLDDLAEVVRGEESIHFDLTHGLRHLSMLALVGARLLDVLYRNLSVEQIWYGAFEVRDSDGTVPVIGLDGLLRLQEWIEVWSRFEDDGDYDVLADLLEREGVDPAQADLLRQAAFYESVLNLPEARRRLLSFLPTLSEPLPGPARLFGPRLKERLAWVRRDNLYEHQRRLAHLHLAKGDYLRAAILANEAVLTHWMAKCGQGNVNRQEDREKARKAVLKEMKESARDAEREDFCTLEYIRNTLAHGSVPRSKRIRELLLNRERLRRELERIISRLLS